MKTEEEMYLQWLEHLAIRTYPRHEGEHIIRRIYSNNGPDICAVFKQQDMYTVVCCPLCYTEFGQFDANQGKGVQASMTAICASGYYHLSACHFEQDVA